MYVYTRRDVQTLFIEKTEKWETRAHPQRHIKYVDVENKTKNETWGVAYAQRCTTIASIYPSTPHKESQLDKRISTRGQHFTGIVIKRNWAGMICGNMSVVCHDHAHGTYTAPIPIANAATPHATDLVLGSSWNRDTRLLVAIGRSSVSGSLKLNRNSLSSASSSRSLFGGAGTEAVSGTDFSAPIFCIVRSAFKRSISSFCSAMSCVMLGLASSIVSASSSTTVSSDAAGVVTSVTRTARAGRTDFGDLKPSGVGRGTGLFVRADRRGGGRVLLLDGGAGAGDDSRRRLGVGRVIDGAGVNSVLAGLAAGVDGWVALGVALGFDRR